MLHFSAVDSLPAIGGSDVPRVAACVPTAPGTFRSARYLVRFIDGDTSWSVANFVLTQSSMFDSLTGA